MDVLLAQRDLMEARMVLIETKQQQLAAIVNTYQALGGGGMLTDGNQLFGGNCNVVTSVEQNPGELPRQSGQGRGQYPTPAPPASPLPDLLPPAVDQLPPGPERLPPPDSNESGEGGDGSARVRSVAEPLTDARSLAVKFVST